ncbi:MAG: hypothetical protein QM831_23945 [Kofleriaceae bacterium]
MLDVFLAIHPDLLAKIVGGRQVQGPQQADPQLLQSMQQLAQSVQQVGQTVAQAKSQSDQGWQQMVGQMMQAKMGGGGAPQK